MTIYPPTSCCGANGGGGDTVPGQASYCSPVCLLDYVPTVEHAAIFAGTSTYDCRAALQAAIDAAYAAGGNTVMLPRGQVYLRGSSGGIYMRSRVTLRGMGKGISRIRWNSRASDVHCFTRDPGQSLTDATFADFSISGVGDMSETGTGKRAFWIDGPEGDDIVVRRVTWDGVEITDIREFAILVRTASEITINNCALRRVTRDGIAVWQSSNVRISDNIVEHCFGRGISADMVNGESVPVRSGVVIERNYLFMTGGIGATGLKRATISNNVCFLTMGSGIAVYPDTDAATTIHSINISDNIVSDSINQPAAVRTTDSCNYYVIGGGIASTGSETGLPGRPDTLGVFTPLFGEDTGSFYAKDAINNTLANAHGAGIIFSGNVACRTLPAVSNVSDWGLGSLFVGPESTDNSGWYDGPVAEEEMRGNGIVLRAFMRNAHISDNVFWHCGSRAVWCRFTVEDDGTGGVLPNLAYEAVEIVDNEFVGFHEAGFVISTSGSAPMSFQDIRIRRNRFNGDPLYEHSGRTSQGGWSNANDSHDLPGILLVNVSGILIEENEFANVKAPVTNSGAYTAFQKNERRNNTVIGEPAARGYSPLNLGVGNMPDGYDGWKLRWFGTNIGPQFGTVIDIQLMSSDEMPTTGAYLAGHFVTCSEPSAVHLGGRLIGWRRLTTGVGHEPGVDWEPISCTHGALSVKLFGAKGDGTTNDAAAITAAIAVASSGGEDVWWPPGDYICNSSIPNLHEVRHRGRGRIVIRNGGKHINTGTSLGPLDTVPEDTVEDAIWQVEAMSTAFNQLYVSPSGNDTNDGLTTGRPLLTIDRSKEIIAHYGPHIKGRWAVLMAAGEYSGTSELIGIRSVEPIKFRGPDVPKTGTIPVDVESPERHAYENPVPTAVIRHPNTGVTGVGPTSRAFTVKDGANVELKNIKFVGPWEIGFYCSGFVTYTLRNCHFDLENDGEWPDEPGQDNPWRKYGKTAISEVFAVRGTFYGGRIERAETGISQIFSCMRNLDVTNESLRNGAGTLVSTCGVGMRCKEDGNGHIDFATFEDCGTGVELQAWSTANFKGSNFKRCGAGIVLVNSEAHNEGGVGFFYGTVGDKYPDGVGFLMYGNASALVGFGWEANPGDPTLRNGYRPMNMIGSDYAETMTSDDWLGATTPNSQRIYQQLCLPPNVYNVRGMRFTTKIIVTLPAGTTAGDIRFLYTVSDIYFLDLIIPPGTVVPVGGAIAELEWDSVCIEDRGVYRCTAKGVVRTSTGQIAAMSKSIERTVDLEDSEHSVGIDVRILDPADLIYFQQGETWG